jgi:acetyltransferase-like isoleucine patch superfamily enzyme
VVIAPIHTQTLGIDDGVSPATATTVIGRRAAIGSRATIKAGCHIGENALVGAGAVVLDDVPAGAVVMGNPAKIVHGGRAVEQLQARQPPESRMASAAELL